MLNFLSCLQHLQHVSFSFAGLTLMHYAALHNRPQLITVLIQQVMDINARKLTGGGKH